MTGSPEAAEWDEDDKAMFEVAEEKWRRIIGHECGHTTATLANDNCPDEVLAGQLVDQHGNVHQALTINGALPDTATVEARATVLLAGLVAEELLFGSHANGAVRDREELEPMIKEIMKREGETRSEAEIEADLMAETRSLLQKHKAVLEDLYKKGVATAAETGFAQLNLKGVAIHLLTGETIQESWDAFGSKE